MTGALSIRFEPAGARIRRQEPPWRVIRSFSSGAGEALVHLHNVSGGVLDNDHLALEVEVAPGALAQVTSTGATRLYRSRGATARLCVDVRVGEGGLLEWLPDPLIPFAGARAEQQTRIVLEQGATLFWWEQLAPGRAASSEVFRYQSLRILTELVAGARPIAIEHWAIEPRQRPPESPARLGDFQHVATFYICQVGLDAERWRELESALSEISVDRSRAGHVLWGVSTLPAHGLVVRGVSRTGRDLTAGLLAFWQAAKPSLCGRVAVVPRKIY